MPITVATFLWAMFGLTSLAGLYFFNSGRGLFSFITSRKFLFIFLVAAIFGMRQMNWEALIILAIALFIMYKDYKPYIEKCRRLKAMKDIK